MPVARPIGPADRAAWWAGTLFGIGRAPIAPGTVASAAALLAVAAMPRTAYGPVTLILALAACALAPAAARRVARMTRAEDPQCFVLDEAAGIWLSVLRPERPTLLTFALAFTVFRVLDIWKPWPIRRFESIGRGWGVLLDDVVAGVLTLLITVGFDALLR